MTDPTPAAAPAPATAPAPAPAPTSATTGLEDARSGTTATHVAPDVGTTQPPIESTEAGTGTEYLAAFRLDDRVAKQPVARNQPIIEVLVNFEHLRSRVFNLLEAAYRSWDPLRSRINADRTRIDTAIIAGCYQLSFAYVYLLYGFLRRKTSRFHPSKYQLYRNRCFFDEKREVPEGLAYLIEQFGVSAPVEFFGNNRYIHVWDNEHPDAFGINHGGNIPQFDEDTLHGFLQSIRSCGVPFRSVDSRAPARTVWDSLLVVNIAGSGLTFETTFPSQEYDLPRDIFLAYGLNRATGNNGRGIQRYYPRLGAVNQATRTAMLADNNADNPFAPRPGVAKPVTTATGADATVNATHPSGHIARVHETGVISRITGINPGPPPTTNYDYHALVYGRGPDLSAMSIMSVGRGITDFEIDGYFRNLFRKKA